MLNMHQTHMSCRGLHRSASTATACGMYMVWHIEWHDHLHINNNNNWIIITDYLNFTRCQVTKNNSFSYTHVQLFI